MSSFFLFASFCARAEKATAVARAQAPVLPRSNDLNLKGAPLSDNSGQQRALVSFAPWWNAKVKYTCSPKFADGSVLRYCGLFRRYGLIVEEVDVRQPRTSVIARTGPFITRGNQQEARKLRWLVREGCLPKDKNRKERRKGDGEMRK